MKLIKVICMAICLILLLSIVVCADEYADYQSDTAYYSYEYNGFDELSSAPDGYIAKNTIYLSDIGENNSQSAFSDIYFDGKYIYVLDAGTSRILILNQDFTLHSIIDSNEIDVGEYSDTDICFLGASGIFVEEDGSILICDTDRERVLIIHNKVLTGIIHRPDTTALSDQIKFDVKKAVKAGDNYYVTAESVVSGTLVFNEELEFVRFFGSNNVAITGEVLLHALQSFYMSDAQIAARRKFAASKITSVDVDKNGFIVVVSSDPTLTVDGSAVRCLNYKGDDITSNKKKDRFGDREITQTTANTFTDVSVDDDNFYVLLDEKYGRVFVYSEEGILVSQFGGIGSAMGMFSKPVSVEAMDQTVLVLDAKDNAISVFEPTEYSRIKRELLTIIDTGNYDRISILSNDLLKYNTNCQYAYYAKGFVAENKGLYKNAMEYYEKANDRESYAQAFKLYRTQIIKKNFLLVFLVVLIIVFCVIAVSVFLSKGLHKKEGEIYSPLERGKGFPIYCLFHPADGFSQIKQRNVLSKLWLGGIIVAWCWISVVRYFLMGYMHNQNRAQDFNLLIELTKTLGILALFVISNWAICTLIDGKGKPKEIVYTVVYSLIPYVIVLIISLPLSLILTSEEAVLMTMLMTVGKLWTAMVLFVGLLTIHEYSVGKAVFSIFLTVVGMAILLLLIIMFCTLITQVVTFVQSLIQEYSFQH